MLGDRSLVFKMLLTSIDDHYNFVNNAILPQMYSTPFHPPVNSLTNQNWNGFEVCWTNSGRLRTSVNFPSGNYSTTTKVIESGTWHHLGMTWIKATGLTILLDGVFHRNVPGMVPEHRTGSPCEIEVTLGALARNPTEIRFMAEVTVDELYFWEKWMTNLAIWKVYARSIFGG